MFYYQHCIHQKIIKDNILSCSIHHLSLTWSTSIESERKRNVFHLENMLLQALLMLGSPLIYAQKFQSENNQEDTDI